MMKNRNEMMLRRARARQMHRAINSSRRVNEDWALEVVQPDNAQINEAQRQEVSNIFVVLVDELESCFELTADNTFAFIAGILRNAAQLTNSLILRYSTDFIVVNDNDNNEEGEIEIDDEYTAANKKSRRRK